MTYKAKPVGTERICLMSGLPDDILNNPERICGILSESLEEEGYTVLDGLSHEFEPQGFTRLYPLEGLGHGSVHTNPELGSIYFNLVNGNGTGDERGVFDYLRETLKPSLPPDYFEHSFRKGNGKTITAASCVMFGVDDEVLENNMWLDSTGIEAFNKNGFKINDNPSYRTDGGYTCVTLLSESHAGVHIRNEDGSALFFLYSCRGPPESEEGRKAYELVKARTGPHEDTFQLVRPVVIDLKLKLKNSA
jgi:S-adenosylmethionine/arginine decarboxylase-like enzyme